MNGRGWLGHDEAAFTAYEPGFTGGVRIAAVGTTEPGGTQYQIVTVSGPGRPLEVRAWAVGGGTANMVRSIPVSADFQLGAFIDVADLNGDGSPEAVLATDRGIPSLIGGRPIVDAYTVFAARPASSCGCIRLRYRRARRFHTGVPHGGSPTGVPHDGSVRHEGSTRGVRFDTTARFDTVVGAHRTAVRNQLPCRTEPS